MLAAFMAMGGVPMSSMAGSAAHAGGNEVARQWAVFRRKYFRPDGRIVDTGNNGESHSEGQGYGMLFAAVADDLPTFETMWNWTQATLRHTKDGLFSWRFLPGHTPAVPDTNNATDGDLLIALALARAGRRWHRPDFVQEPSRSIATCCGS